MIAVMGEMFGELVRYRGLLAMLAWRDIRVRYKQSLLGVAWAFLMPLIQTLVLWAIIQFGPMTIDARDRDYMPSLLFVLSGVIPWTLFNSTLSASVESLTRNSRLVTKIYFPREVFPLGTVAGAIVDFSISLSILVPVYAYYAIRDRGVFEPHVHLTPMLLVLPFILLIQLLLVAGLSLIVSMANLFFRDVKYLMTFVLQLWFFATNVMYPIKFVNHPALRWLASANPMIAILNAYRDCLMGNGFHDAGGLFISAAVAMLVFLGGWRAFHEAEFKFAEYV
jgi:lipopolysaccharide transport system permease protein